MSLPGWGGRCTSRPGTPTGPPRSDVIVPPAVAAAAGGRLLKPVWENEAGGLTFEVGDGVTRCFIKWAPAGSGLDLAAEADRMSWAAAFHPVPKVLACGAGPAGAWLVTAGLPGTVR